MLDPTRHNGRHNGVARGIARGRASGFVRCEGDLPGPEQHPEIQLRDEEAPLTEQTTAYNVSSRPVTFLSMWSFKNEPLSWP
jgi:hypothetical protein